MLQYGEMEMMTKEGHSTKMSVEAEGDRGLLNLPPEETVFYVGGYPSNFMVLRLLKMYIIEYVYVCMCVDSLHSCMMANMSSLHSPLHRCSYLISRAALSLKV